jgi:hypothetical protein
MSPRRKVPDAETAQAWLAAVQQSGLTPVEWCAEAGVDARSLHCWRLTLARRSAEGAPQFVEVVPRSERVTIPTATAGLRVHVRDVVVEVATGFDADTLAEVLRVVRAC